MSKSMRLMTCGLVTLAILSRVSAVWVLQSHHVPRSTYEHGEIAASLLAGKGFATKFLGAFGPTSQQAPVYPALVALAYAAGGVESPRALLFLHLGQAILGGLLVLGVIGLASAIAPGKPWIALLAGLVCALHPTLVYAATHVQVALLGATLLIWTLAAAYRTGCTGSMRSAGVAGLILGLLILTDPILTLVFPGVVWAVCAPWAGPIRLRRSFALIACTGITAAVVIIPWLVRNARVHGEFVAVKSTFGYAFWQGNCKQSEGTDKVVRNSVGEALDRTQKKPGFEGLNRKLWEARHEAGYIDDIALSRQDYLMLGQVSEPERSRILFRRALAELSSTPGRYLRLCMKRLRYFLLFDETNPKTRVLAYRVPHLALSFFGILGLCLAGASLRRRLMPTIATAALITVFHCLTIVSARFHIPIEPLLGLWGATGLCHAAQTLWGRRYVAPAHRVVRDRAPALAHARFDTTSNESGSKTGLPFRVS